MKTAIVLVANADLGIITIEGQRHELVSIIMASPRTRNTIEWVPTTQPTLTRGTRT